MIKWIRNLKFRLQMRSLTNSINACFEGDVGVRELQEIGRHMRAVGDKFDIESWREMGDEIEANAEEIVLARIRR